VKTYSSGMMVRLAFAVQAQVEPDILIVDEALAVGDAKFQARCFERLKQLKENGTSILLVTHSSEQIVTHCSRALLLADGAVMEIGEPRHVVNRYMDLLFGKELILGANERFRQSASEAKTNVAHDVALSTDHDVFSTRPGYNPHEYRWGDGAARILDFHISVNDFSYPNSISAGEHVRLAFTVRFDSQLVRPILGITIKTKEGVTVYGFNSETMGLDSLRSVGDADTVIRAETDFSCRLASGDYFVSLGIATRHAGEVIPHDRRYDAIHIQIRPDDTFFGLVNLGAKLSATTISS
jgi:lipopolysaccharide transport system ATP-binding protein